MIHRLTANLTAPMTDLRRRIMRPTRLAFLPLVFVVATELLSRPIAEAAGLVLATLLAGFAIWPGPAMRAATPPASAARDPLTGLPLRSALTDHLRAVAASGDGKVPVCICVRIADLPRLSARLGPEGRRQVVRRAAERLQLALRSDDVLAATEAGTFIVCLAAMPPERLPHGRLVAQRIRNSLSEPLLIHGHSTELQVALGIATPDPLDIQDLPDAAEAAMAEALQAGCGEIRRYTPEMHARLSRLARLSREVDSAIAAGEIRAWFQPQTCTDTGRISGFEALARWHHPDLGVLSPGEFLPAIARAGRLPHLGDAMLAQALAAMASWDRAGYAIPTVSVNFSTDELRDPTLSDRVKWEVDRLGLRPSRLTIEILESVAAAGHDDTILRNIDAMCSHGFHLDLDDFGTGQASIANIRRFQVQRIKIDRSFVSNIDQDPAQQSAVTGILSLAQHLGVEALAEGVEGPGEHALLAQLGCQHVQGYGIARPMPFEKTPAWIEGYRAKLATPPAIGRRSG